MVRRYDQAPTVQISKPTPYAGVLLIVFVDCLKIGRFPNPKKQ